MWTEPQTLNKKFIIYLKFRRVVTPTQEKKKKVVSTLVAS